MPNVSGRRSVARLKAAKYILECEIYDATLPGFCQNMENGFLVEITCLIRRDTLGAKENIGQMVLTAENFRFILKSFPDILWRN